MERDKRIHFLSNLLLLQMAFKFKLQIDRSIDHFDLHLAGKYYSPSPPWTLCRKERGNGGKLEGGEQVVPLFKFRTRLGLPCLARIAYEK